MGGVALEIVVKDDKKRVEVWLTRAEKNDVQLKESLKPMFAEYKAKRYLCVVYNSGDSDLFANTRDLLLHNKEVIAKKISLDDIPTTS